MSASEKPEGVRWMAIFGIIVRTAYVVGVLYYVAFTASGFDAFQKLVVLIIAAIIYGAASAIIHVAWPGRRRRAWSWLWKRSKLGNHLDWTGLPLLSSISN
ncbi:MAG: hypothetical protein AUJ07_02605 [Crenarchaeota archaeon 13_1_40CM_3_53_5]|nr:MAG: hypothetical protein AUJ07_02605 [Crenarchaeota archaeon 13_1_40CM_3_53_5]